MSVRNNKWNGEDWEPTPLPAAPCRGAMEEQLDSLKEQLLAPLLASVKNAALAEELRWVANEAAALAWLTTFPILVLPTLMEEKILAALQQWERQQRVWKRSNPSLTANAGLGAASILPHLTCAMMAA